MPSPAIKNYGFITPVITPDNYVFGAGQLPEQILQPNGQWGEFLPDEELQRRNGLETSNCTNYGTLNCIETILRRKYGTLENYSERYTGVMTGTTREGNQPHDVAEKIRKECGLIPEGFLPFSEDIRHWGDYYSPNPMSEKFLKVGREWLQKYQFKHEWVFTGGFFSEKRAKLMEALKYSPLGVSVRAWDFDGEFYTKQIGEGDTHWAMLYGYEEGVCWYVFDHYDNTRKRLIWNYDFGFAKRYFVEKWPESTAPNTASIKKLTFVEWLIRLFKKFF